MDEGHKTSVGEFQDWRDDIRVNGIRRRPKGSRRQCPEHLLFNDEIPFGGPGDRASNRLPSLPDGDASALDAMLEKHGLLMIVKTLRELCDSRQPSMYETDMTFEKLSQEEEWTERSDALEALIARINK